MNPSPSTIRPRLTCRLVRKWAAAFGDPASRQPHGLGSRHLETCADCQAFFSACDDLDASLKRDASTFTQAPVAGLDDRILRAVRMSEPPPRRAHTRALTLSFAGAAACAAVAVFFFQRHNEDDAATHLAEHGSLPSVADMMVAADALSDRLWNSLKPSAQALSDQNPLQQEIDLVYSDARSALDFLARNFLPSSENSFSEQPETSASSQTG